MPISRQVFIVTLSVLPLIAVAATVHAASKASPLERIPGAQERADRLMPPFVVHRLSQLDIHIIDESAETS
ncbi:hypothetical protein [Nonomuraea sp. NPDC049695]|uniref:hypothetical protein n=1 Tax=Nonomuraea sp. NPDC049695 TaxID=3154734 RepID=UPI0034446702